MRILKTIVLSFILVSAVACSDEETDVEKYYKGNWVINSPHPEVDSVTNFFISAEGNFTYDLNYGGATEKVIGIVRDNGDLRADIMVDTILLGISRGKLTQEGTGSGEYTIVNQQFQWTATKQ